jgi:methionyl-tRNA synthetase
MNIILVETVLVNLAPRKLRGTVSQGMILLAEDPEGKLVFVNPDEDSMNGAVIA